MTSAEIRQAFRDLRTPDYKALAGEARVVRDLTSARSQTAETAYIELCRRTEDLRRIDFFDCPGKTIVHGVMTEIDELRSAKDNRMKVPVKKRGQAKIWVTRKSVRADRIGSAWLIRRFIDPRASFRFVTNDYVIKRGEIRFDMFEGDSRAQMTGVPLKRWSTLTASPQMGRSWFSQRSYMTLTLKDERYQRPETTGLARLINGMCLTVPTDAGRLERGAIIFDSLYNGLARSGEAPKFVSFFTGYLTICSGRIQETFSGGDARRSEYGGSSANPAG